MHHLLKLYISVHARMEEDESVAEQTRIEFKKLSEGDPENTELWKKFTEQSLAQINAILDILDVKPDYAIGESFYEGLNLPQIGDQPPLKYSMKSIVRELVDKGIATQNEDGSVGVEFSKESKIPSCVLQKRDGTHGYLASDLATVRYRLENWSPKKIIYCIDVRQQLHLRQVFYIARAAGWEGIEDTELFHASNGFIALKE